MRRSILLSVVVVALLATSLAMAQPPPAGVPGPAGPGGPGGPGMDRMGGMMDRMPAVAPVMTVTDKYVYVIYAGQLTMFNAETLEMIKSVPLPMMMRGGRDGQARGGQRGGGAGNPPPPPPAP